MILLNGDLADLERETYSYKGNERPNAVHFCWEGLKDNFPEVADHILARKRVHEDVSYGQMLNRLEVRAMVHGTARRCLEDGIECVTVHDCVAAKESDIEDVRAGLKDTFDRLFGLVPSVERE